MQNVEPYRRITGLMVGALASFLVTQLNLLTLVSWNPPKPIVIVLFTITSTAVWKQRLFRNLLSTATVTLVLLWLVVAFTPISSHLIRPLIRNEKPVAADAVFVLASSLQKDGELSTSAMSRLLQGITLIAQGYAPRLILTELPEPYPSYTAAALKLMRSLKLDYEIVSLQPAHNTHDEAVLVGKLFRSQRYERILLVTSPMHTRRASAVLEKEGVRVIVSASFQTSFDTNSLQNIDDRVRAFPYLIHEYAGLLYYWLRGWL